MKWFHRIRFPDGTVTPGICDQSLLEPLVAEIPVAGRTVLDVGTLDGKWAMAAHAAGADSVLAIDPHVRFTWHQAHGAFGEPESVGVIRATLEAFTAFQAFDVVYDMGVYYHTDDMLGHFKALARCVKPGGIAVVEGEVATDQLASVAFFYPTAYSNGDTTTRWVPSLSCLRQMIEYAGLRVKSERIYSDMGVRGRAFLVVEAP